MDKKLNTERTAVPFDKNLSMELDQATIAFEDAKAAGDVIRMLYTAEWKRRVEARIWGDAR